MISWRVYLALIVVFYSKSVLSYCNYDYNCPGSETCCGDNYCSDNCDGSGVSTAILVVIIILAVAFKTVFWIAVCYCRRRRYRGVVFNRFDTAPRTAVVVNRSTHVMQQGHNLPQQSYNPPQQSYNPPQPSYNPPKKSYNPQQQNFNPPQQAYNPAQQQDEQGSPPGYSNPQNTTPGQNVLIDLADNPPPPYTNSPSS